MVAGQMNTLELIEALHPLPPCNHGEAPAHAHYFSFATVGYYADFECDLCYYVAEPGTTVRMHRYRLGPNLKQAFTDEFVWVTRL